MWIRLPWDFRNWLWDGEIVLEIVSLTAKSWDLRGLQYMYLTYGLGAHRLFNSPKLPDHLKIFRCFNTLMLLINLPMIFLGDLGAL